MNNFIAKILNQINFSQQSIVFKIKLKIICDAHVIL